MKIIILAGGQGTRLFPLSRTCYPKQFLKIAGQKSLLQQTVERFLGIVKQENILIVTNKEHIFHLKEDLQEINANQVHIIPEPIGKNTAAAIALAIRYCKDVLSCDEDEVLFVTPADHIIMPVDVFQELIIKAEKTSQQSSCIITLGVKPTKPETGYGYIEVSERKVLQGYEVEHFKEKPNSELAKQYVDSGKYYWNAGMFLFPLNVMEKEIIKYNPKIADIAVEGYDYCINNYEKMPNISIDYAVAEKSNKMIVIPLEGIYWNDIGSFDAISDMLQDEKGNTLSGDIIVKNCSNTMILGSKRLISAIDIDNLLVVDTPDALLVSRKGSSQNVKEVVEMLKSSNRKEISENLTMYRPWGSYTVLAEGEGYKVKRITIKPGAKLSLQMHYHRSEHWTVISGTGKLTLDDKEIFFKENESVYIPIATKHRLENPGQIPLSIIEVQNGRYLGEDDIVRFNDVYGR